MHVGWVHGRMRAAEASLAPHPFTISSAGRVSHPHLLQINQEVIAAARLFIAAAASRESTLSLGLLDDSYSY